MFAVETTDPPTPSPIGLDLDLDFGFDSETPKRNGDDDPNLPTPELRLPPEALSRSNRRGRWTEWPPDGLRAPTSRSLMPCSRGSRPSRRSPPLCTLRRRSRGRGFRCGLDRCRAPAASCKLGARIGDRDGRGKCQGRKLNAGCWEVQAWGCSKCKCFHECDDTVVANTLWLYSSAKTTSDPTSAFATTSKASPSTSTSTTQPSCSLTTAA